MKTEQKNLRGYRTDPETFQTLAGVVQTGMSLLNDLELYLQPFGLSYSRFSILLALLESEDPERISSDLSRRMGISRPTVSRLIGRLTGDGLVRKEPSPDDGRSFRMGLTSAGRNLLEQAIPGYARRMDRICAGLDRKDRQMLTELLSRLHLPGGSGNTGGSGSPGDPGIPEVPS